jgi:hypothetical protein
VRLLTLAVVVWFWRPILLVLGLAAWFFHTIWILLELALVAGGLLCGGVRQLVLAVERPRPGS